MLHISQVVLFYRTDDSLQEVSRHLLDMLHGSFHFIMLMRVMHKLVVRVDSASMLQIVMIILVVVLHAKNFHVAFMVDSIWHMDGFNGHAVSKWVIMVLIKEGMFMKLIKWFDKDVSVHTMELISGMFVLMDGHMMIMIVAHFTSHHPRRHIRLLSDRCLLTIIERARRRLWLLLLLLLWLLSLLWLLWLLLHLL